MTAHRLDGCHVDRINIGSFFSINLDADVFFIHQSRNFLVLERLSFHNVTPVAGRVTDAQKNRNVTFPGLLESLVSPGKPLHRIVRVLQEIGAGFVN